MISMEDKGQGDAAATAAAAAAVKHGIVTVASTVQMRSTKP